MTENNTNHTMATKPPFVNYSINTLWKSFFEPFPMSKFDWFTEDEKISNKLNEMISIDRDYNLHSVKNEKGDIVKYVMEVPYTPFSKENVKILLNGNMLNVFIGGKKENKEENKEKKYYVRQISENNFKFNLNISGLNVNKKQISAVCEDGILKINLPVFQPSPKAVDAPTEIKIS